MFETLTNKLKSYPTQETAISRVRRWQTHDIHTALRFIGYNVMMTDQVDTFNSAECAITHWKDGNQTNVLFPENSDCTHSLVRAPYSCDILKQMEKDIKNDPEWNAYLRKESEIAIKENDPE